MRKKDFIKGIVCGLLIPLIIVAVLIVANVGGLGSYVQTLRILSSHSLTSLSFADKVTGSIEGMVGALEDPYSYYMNADEYGTFVSEVSGSYEGIGAYINIDENGQATIMAPIKNTPAFEAGLAAGDWIISIDGESTSGKTAGEVAEMIKGDSGSTVALEIKRGDEEVKTYTIERRDITIPTVESRYLEDVDGNIGYIAITLFNNLTGTDFANALNELTTERDLDGLIIDLRNNPGGSVSGATSVASQFVPNGQPIFQAVERGQNYTVDAETEDVLEIPMVLLVNENSASASEILAGCLQDYEIATLVGSTTFGKGVIQTIFSLPDGDGAIKVTTAKYLTPNGNEIHDIGVTPDVEEALNGNSAVDVYTLDPTIDNQLAKAIEVLTAKIAEQ